MDGFALWKHLHEAGWHGIIRGDEAFGYKKVSSREEAYSLCKMVALNDLPELRAHAADLDVVDHSRPPNLEQRAGETLASWRDRLDHEFHMPTVLAALPVTSSTVGAHVNTTGPVSAAIVGNGNAANATLSVDPPAPAGSGLVAPYHTGGPGFVAGRLPDSPVGTEVLRYDQEYLWVYDDMDSTWHFPEPHHSHNMQDCDANDPMNPALFYNGLMMPMPPNLNIFNPNVFTVSGKVMDYGQTGPGGTGGYFEGSIPEVGINATAGERVLLRFLNAAK